MSLIRVRRNRKREFIDVRRGASAAKLVVLLLAVIALIWYLGYRF